MTAVTVDDNGDKSEQSTMPSEVEVISSSADYGTSGGGSDSAVLDTRRHRYPFCIVWTPIPFLT